MNISTLSFANQNGLVDRLEEVVSLRHTGDSN